MKDVVRVFHEFFEKNDEFNRQMDAFVWAKRSDEWKFFNFMLQTMKGVMASDMLSRRFSDLSKEDKDVVSRTYYQLSNILDFFSNPYAIVGRRKLLTKIKQTLPSGKEVPKEKGK